MSQLNELMERDPLTLTRDDVEEVAKALRAQRAMFVIPKAVKRTKAESEMVTLDQLEIVMDGDPAAPVDLTSLGLADG